jgi:Domain of unknown function (DUF4145)
MAMAAARDLWGNNFSEYQVPAFPCPKCDRGNLVLIHDSLQTQESEWMSEERNAIGLDHDEASAYQFIAFLRCVVPQCGQIVSMHGDVKLQRSRYEEFGEEFERILLPTGMSPTPALVTIPPGTPGSVSNELRVAFQLFWVDFGACANRLRISVERILDEFGIARGRLFERIEVFQKTDPEHAATFDALRHVGNLGSHDGDVSREAMLDAFEIYQDALAQLFSRRKVRIDDLKQKLIAAKGKY